MCTLNKEVKTFLYDIEENKYLVQEMQEIIKYSISLC